MSTTCESTWRSRRRVSVARPSIPGSQTSRMIRSIAPRVSRSRHSSPLATESTIYPSSRRSSPSAFRTPGSSSTISTVGVMTGSFVVRRPAESTCASCSRRTPHAEPRTTIVSTWQLNCKPRTVRRVVADFDAATVFGDDPAHDRETEPAAAPFGRVIREEQLLALGRRDARAVVCDNDTDEVVSGVELRLDHDVASPLHGLDRVVDQVDDDATDLLHIQPHQRNAGRKPLRDPYVAEDAIVQRERIGDELANIRRHRARRWHARELRELVNEALQRLHFTDD